jgi:AcrR family transcriptional regulator
MPSLAPQTPARGTRPRNRRELTIEAATELFYRRGYADVGMTDIAAATNVGASALYRHFPSKAELLVAAIRTGLGRYQRVFADAGSIEGDPRTRLDVVLRRLSEAAVGQRQLGVLWQRESRNLPDAEQRMLREELSATNRELSAYVLAARPDLDEDRADVLAWCAMSALVSISFHALELPQPAFTDLIVDLVSEISWLPMPATEASDAPAPRPKTAEPETRRDSLITVATTLFAERGFAATGIDEIGDAAGIAGPSVYSHFESKQAILVAAIRRASDVLRSDYERVLADDAPAPRKLAQLVDSYVRIANRDRFVIRTLLSEMGQLPQADRESARQEQRQFIDDWVALLREFTDVDAVSARIRVQAVLLVVNDAVQTPHLRDRPGFEQTLARMSKTLLGIPST